jgi:hypothetical protein
MLLAIASNACVASAQSSTLRLESDAPSTEYKIYAGTRARSPWLQCVAPCALVLPEKKYRVEVDGPRIPRGQTIVTLKYDARVVTHAGNSTVRTIGLVTGIVATAATGVALVGAFVSDCFSLGPGACETQRAADDAKEQTRAFRIVAGVGAVVALVGWIAFWCSDTSVEVKPLRHRRVVAFGLGPTSGGGAEVGALGIF